jgi:hypothetical protein
LSTWFILTGFNYYCDDVPVLNEQIKKFVESKLNKKVGRGECWDLAAEALNLCDAKWDGNYSFGKLVDHKKDCIYEGDIIQFEGVELKYKKDEATFVEKLEHHTAIVYQVKEKGIYVIADQNTRFSGRKVGIHNLELNTLTKGKIKIFRPIK